MSVHVSALSTNPQDVPSIVRHTADYHPSIWGDYFLSFATNSTQMDEKTKQQVQELKEEVRRMLTAPHGDMFLHKLHLIDTVQRLGVSYHFESEIDQALQQILKNSKDNIDDQYCDLYNVAFQFRLFRQQGFYVSCDVFDKFKDKNGEFKKSIVSDVRGMLCLYEATHLRVHGEDVLDEALAFTTTQLELSLASQLNDSLAAQVNRTLKQPLHHGIPRLEARLYISNYQDDPSHNEVLLTFAKLDFNLLQKVHQKELSELTRWWGDLDFKSKLPFARDRVVECYLWILGVYYEPRYVLGRRTVTKMIAMLSIVDDSYDNYGTIEELELFTEAIQRWDIAAIDQLPEYMQLIYQALLDLYSEFELQMAPEGKSYLVNYLKEPLECVVKAYLQEAKWFNQQYTPTMEEYMSVALVTTCYRMLATTSFLGMGDLATKDAFEWILKEPKIIRSSSVICRLTDDIVSSKFEQQRGHVASSIECYMKQHGAAEEEVIKEFRKQISDGWKDINQECLQPTCVPMPLLTRILNFTRVMDVVYKDDDGYTNAEIYLKDFITSVLVDSVPI